MLSLEHRAAGVAAFSESPDSPEGVPSGGRLLSSHGREPVERKRRANPPSFFRPSPGGAIERRSAAPPGLHEEKERNRGILSAADHGLAPVATIKRAFGTPPLKIY